MKYFYVLLFFLFICMFSSCSEETVKKKYTIGFSQAMTTDNWRREMNKSMKLEASMRPDLELEIKDAENDVSKQITQIDEFIAQKVDVLIVSPIQSAPITPAIEKAMEANIPTIVIDRKVEGRNFTAYIGANNVEIGKNAAKYIISHSNTKSSIIEITGLQESSPAYERSFGFRTTIDSNDSLRISHIIYGDWEKSSVKPQLAALLDSIKAPKYIFAHNDRMALGAWEVAKQKSLDDEINIIGVDGLHGPNAGIQMVKDDIIKATILYPTGGSEAIRLADDILNKEGINRNNLLRTVVIDSVNVDIMQNQFNKMNQQQNDIEQQQAIIDEQIETYNSQSELILLMLVLLGLLLVLTIWGVYMVVKIKKSKRELEINNAKIIIQRNQIENFAEKLKLSNESKLNFFTALSHEFKTPLTLITSSIESISDRANKNLKGFSYETNLIINNSRRLLRLINELLDFRKLENGTYNVRPVRTEIVPFLESIIDDFRTEAFKKMIDLDFSLEKKDVVELYIDRNMMDKVFFNILSNALKFTPKNGSIKLALFENEGTVDIVVKDSGIGIPREEFKRIFDPYMQGSNNMKPSSGLGLHISKKFVELHSGEIKVSSHQGAEFRVSIPKGKDHFKDKDISDITTDAPLTRFKNLSEATIPIEEIQEELEKDAETILIIEDNTDLSFLLKKKLRKDYRVYLSDGTDGIEKALEIIPDAIICDLNLPDIDGFEICSELKKDLRTSHIPTLILTAHNDKDSKVRALKAGADTYITKPFHSEILKESLKAILYNREKIRYYYINKINEVKDEHFEKSEQNFLKEFNTIIDENIRCPEFSVEQLASRLNISRVQLYRKVKALMGVTVSEYINTQRLDKARGLLQESNMNISEIAYEVGYSSPGYFSTSFKNKYGVSPKQWKF